MKIYIGHSRGFDFEQELYLPIRNATELPQQDIVFPHEAQQDLKNPRDFYQNIDLFIAEVSYPATGLGIELGWAYDSKVPIVCIHKTGQKISGSLRAVTNDFYNYNDGKDLVDVVSKIIEDFSK